MHDKEHDGVFFVPASGVEDFVGWYKTSPVSNPLHNVQWTPVHPDFTSKVSQTAGGNYKFVSAKHTGLQEEDAAVFGSHAVKEADGSFSVSVPWFLSCSDVCTFGSKVSVLQQLSNMLGA